MKPRSLTPLWRTPRSSRRSTAWWNVACDSANARWCTQPGAVGVRSGWATRSSFVKIVISRPSPGSKYRWLSAALSRLGCSKTNGIPSTPSQKLIDVWRSAPTMVMWWRPWLWIFCIVSLFGGRAAPDSRGRATGAEALRVLDVRVRHRHTGTGPWRGGRCASEPNRPRPGSGAWRPRAGHLPEGPDRVQVRRGARGLLSTVAAMRGRLTRSHAVAAALAAGAVLAFWALAQQAAQRRHLGWDALILGWVGRRESDPFEAVMVTFSFLGAGTGLLLMLSPLLFVLLRRRRVADTLFVAASLLLAQVVGRVVKDAIDKPRPPRPDREELHALVDLRQVVLVVIAAA